MLFCLEKFDDTTLGTTALFQKQIFVVDTARRVSDIVYGLVLVVEQKAHC